MGSATVKSPARKSAASPAGAAVYKRIVLKLSGEALQGKLGFGIDPHVLDDLAR